MQELAACKVGALQFNFAYMDGGGHSFKTLKRSGVGHEEVVQRLVKETADFAANL
ncbi:MAG: hypothetical protein KDC75_05265 [Phaeodactylibacter sp.]|nr:hypothetical protein [Phaeodactylibacter sp.]